MTVLAIEHAKTGRPASARTEPICLLQLPLADVHGRLSRLDWDFADVRTDDSTHGLHPYPAKFIPQLPARFIGSLTRPGDLVVDPFCGGGTTGVEALRLGRRFLGVDANPIGVLLGKVKTTRLGSADLDRVQDLRTRIESREETAGEWVPDIPNIDKWYSPEVVRRLASIRGRIEELAEGPAKNLALAAFVKTASALSYQESETRYVSKPRPIGDDAPVTRFLAELDRMTAQIIARPDTASASEVEFVVGDARVRSSFPIADQTAGLIVTSPPYPNAYDYHLYHRFRLYWLGEDPGALRRVEVGSHLKHQTEADPAAAFEKDMTAVLSSSLTLLQPGRFCVMIVGDGIYRGEKYPTARRVSEIAADLGFITLPPISRNLPKSRRSVTMAGRRLQHEEIVLMKKPSDKRRQIILVPPSYQRFPYEEHLANREVEVLTGLVPADSIVETQAADVPAVVRQLGRLAFWHGLHLDHGEAKPTFQYRVEDVVAGSRRKNSTYLTHGLHRYKGKFYPQLAKALINLSQVEAGSGLVVDPFGGSGTVLLESVIGGYDALSLDCNPLAIAVASAKIGSLGIDPAVLASSTEALLKGLSRFRTGQDIDTVRSAFAAETFDELESWFPPLVLEKLSFLLRNIRTSAESQFISLAQVVVSDLIREVSQQDPRDLRIRRRSEALVDAAVFELFEQRLRTIVTRLMAWHTLSADLPIMGNGRAVCGDSAAPEFVADTLGPKESIAAVVSSPPYSTALPYLDTDRLSLAAVFGYGKRRRADLESKLVGSREVNRSQENAWHAALRSDQYQELLPASTLDFLLTLSDAVSADSSAGFRKRQMPAVLLRYFVGMSRVMHNTHRHMLPGAHLWFVLGDSRTTVGGHRWTIPTIDEVLAIGKLVGLVPVERIPITVTREDVVHARHTITNNDILHMVKVA